jgi:hypothetical protein
VVSVHQSLENRKSSHYSAAARFFRTINGLCLCKRQTCLHGIYGGAKTVQTRMNRVGRLRHCRACFALKSIFRKQF